MTHNAKNTTSTLHTNLQPNHQQLYHFCCIFITALLCLTVFTNFATAADYYVATDGNDLSPDATNIATPWLTINYAVSAASPVTAGDTVYVRAGTYSETVTIKKAGTNGNPITLKAYNNEEVILDGREVVAGWTQCTNSEAGLTVQGVVNPDYGIIYKTTIHEDDLPASMDNFMIFEDGIHSRIARSPDLVFGYGLNVELFWDVPAEAYGEKVFLLDTDRITQADDYWAGAWVDIYSHLANATLVRRVIASNSGNKLYFDQALVFDLGEGTTTDTYSIANHPHVLDSAGEFAHTMTPDGSGFYTFYLWPINTDNLASKTTVSAKDYGIMNNANDYIVVEDLKCVGYNINGIYMGQSDGNTITGCVIKNCTVEDIGSSGILLHRPTNGLVDGCTINRISLNYGIHLNGLGNSANNIIQNCTVTDSSRTNIYANNIRNIQIIDNIVNTNLGAHGNGIAVYGDSETILIARNTFNRTNLAFNATKDLVVFANVLDREELSTSVINTWANSPTSIVYGLQIYINNTALGDSMNGALGFAGREDPPECLFYVVNNILDGTHSWNEPGVEEMSYNLYTSLGLWQTEASGWSLGEGEIVGTGYALDEIFTGPGFANGEDYTLIGNSRAIGKGKSVTALLDTLGITGDTPWFPGFDFTKDKAGNSWASTPSMGAYEYIMPNAYAGPDQLVFDNDPVGTEPVTLDGSGSTVSSGTIVSWVWTDNRENPINDGEVVTATLSAGVQHTITLTITDNYGYTDTDIVMVTVGNTIYVDRNENPGGDGSKNRPYKTTREAKGAFADAGAGADRIIFLTGEAYPEDIAVSGSLILDTKLRIEKDSQSENPRIGARND